MFVDFLSKEKVKRSRFKAEHRFFKGKLNGQKAVRRKIDELTPASNSGFQMGYELLAKRLCTESEEMLQVDFATNGFEKVAKFDGR